MDPTLETLLTVAGDAAVVLIFLEALKSLLDMNDSAVKRFGPFMAIILGIIVAEFAAIAIGQSGRDLAQAVLTGIMAGSSAMGFYNTTKSAAGAVRDLKGP
jgi:hypothetical protein